MKDLLHKYKHGLLFLYLPLYLIAFFWLENRNTEDYYVIGTPYDNYIPFNEYFIIPYVLWFVYIAATVLYFFFTNKRDFVRICLFLFGGMTICLMIYYLWPNGHHLRANLTTLGRKNIFTELVAYLYSIDTPTNVCPSIHTLNSIGACIAIYKSHALKHKKWIRRSALVLTISICLSTLFLKQHSVFDMTCGCILALIMYWISYVPKFERIPEQITETEAV